MLRKTAWNVEAKAGVVMRFHTRGDTLQFKNAKAEARSSIEAFAGVPDMASE